MAAGRSDLRQPSNTVLESSVLGVWVLAFARTTRRERLSFGCRNALLSPSGTNERLIRGGTGHSGRIILVNHRANNYASLVEGRKVARSESSFERVVPSAA
jgi:hypothetical protein